MKRVLLVLAALLSASLVWSQEVEIEFFTPGIVHVVKSKGGKRQKSLVVTAAPEQVAVSKSGNSFKSKELTVKLNPANNCLTFLTSGGKVLLQEKDWSLEAGAGQGVRQAFRLDKDEAIYGLGTIQNGKLNRRGEHKRMEQSNTEDYQSVVQSI